jgi:hypothetical protein
LIKKPWHLYKRINPEHATFLTNYSVKNRRWYRCTLETSWVNTLLVKYIDGNIKKEKDGKFQTNGTGQAVMPSQPGYPNWWLNEIIREKGDVVKAPKQ